jgi:hypothetical protein
MTQVRDHLQSALGNAYTIERELGSALRQGVRPTT